MSVARRRRHGDVRTSGRVPWARLTKAAKGETTYHDEGRRVRGAHVCRKGAWRWYEDKRLRHVNGEWTMAVAAARATTTTARITGTVLILRPTL